MERYKIDCYNLSMQIKIFSPITLTKIKRLVIPKVNLEK